MPFNRNLVFLDNTSPSVAVQELVNNATTLNFNALLVSDEQQAQRVVPQLQAFNRAVPQNVMVFSLAGSLQLPGIPTIPAIEYSMDAMASRIVNWLTEKTDSGRQPAARRFNYSEALNAALALTRRRWLRVLLAGFCRILTL